AAVSAEIARVISPLALDGALQLIADRERAGAERLRQRELALEQAQYEATGLSTLLDIAATPSPSETDDEAQILSVPIELRRSGREIKMLIDGIDPFATAKPDARLIKLLIRARRFNATLVGSDGVPFAELAKREGVSPSYFTRLVRLSYSPRTSRKPFSTAANRAI
ncbi:MAG: hypothetical protein JO320_06435, partial [Alphaproteobacteria bacterium]|nr:hypothetical protein [Alphaproteobacteria bacterium]